MATKIKSEDEMVNKKTYDLNDMSADEIVEDFFASEEEAERQALLEEGFVEVGTYKPGTEEETEFDKKMEAFLEAME